MLLPRLLKNPPTSFFDFALGALAALAAFFGFAGDCVAAGAAAGAGAALPVLGAADDAAPAADAAEAAEFAARVSDWTGGITVPEVTAVVAAGFTPASESNALRMDDDDCSGCVAAAGGVALVGAGFDADGAVLGVTVPAGLSADGWLLVAGAEVPELAELVGDFTFVIQLTVTLTPLMSADLDADTTAFWVVELCDPTTAASKSV